MGAKASTANGPNSANSQQHNQHMPQSPRTRTFSNSSSSADAAGSTTGFSLLRAIPGMHIATSATNQSAIDRVRARSLSSVPDLQQNNGSAARGPTNFLNGNSNVGAVGDSGGMITFSPEALAHQVATGNDLDGIANASAGALALGRVYTANSLPSHIWSLNGEFVFYLIFRHFEMERKDDSWSQWIFHLLNGWDDDIFWYTFEWCNNEETLMMMSILE